MCFENPDDSRPETHSCLLLLNVAEGVPKKGISPCDTIIYYKIDRYTIVGREKRGSWWWRDVPTGTIDASMCSRGFISGKEQKRYVPPGNPHRIAVSPPHFSMSKIFYNSLIVIHLTGYRTDKVYYRGQFPFFFTPTFRRAQ
jgi:hypothetical protein